MVLYKLLYAAIPMLLYHEGGVPGRTRALLPAWQAGADWCSSGDCPEALFLSEVGRQRGGPMCGNNVLVDDLACLAACSLPPWIIHLHKYMSMVPGYLWLDKLEPPRILCYRVCGRELTLGKRFFPRGFSSLESRVEQIVSVLADGQ